MGPAPLEEVLLVRRLRVAVAGREHHPLDPEAHHLVEELADPGGSGPLEQGGVGGHAEAAPESQPDGLDGLVVDAVPADRLVVLLPETVHVHAEGQVLGRREEGELLLEQDGIGAEIDVLPPLDELDDQLVDIGGFNRHIGAVDAGPGIARCAENFRRLGRLSQLPYQGVFPTALANDQNFHSLAPSGCSGLF